MTVDMEAGTCSGVCTRGKIQDRRHRRHKRICLAGIDAHTP